jgi:hypothetical protein
MTYNIDYHFHPNLPKSEKKAHKKSKKAWENFQKHNINVVISTEHVFKNPQRAFSVMKENKPDDAFLFPGIEYLTQEGIDVLIFSQDEKIYTHKELTPYNLSLEETVTFAEKNNYACSIAHPHTLGTTSIIKRMGQEKYLQYAQKTKSIELSNSSFNNILPCLNFFLLKKIFAKKIKQIENNRLVPEENFFQEVKFFAVGSDAHHPEQIGTYCKLTHHAHELYEKIINNNNPEINEKTSTKTNFIILIRETICVFREFLIKKYFFISYRIKCWRQL